MSKYKYNKLIVFEGVDGAGKSTQINLLEMYLRKNNKKVLKIHCPDYESYPGMLIRSILNGDISNNPDDLNLYAMSLMYTIDRYIIVNKTYRDYFYDNDYIILMDRYTQSNLIHQGAKFIKQHSSSIHGTLEKFMRSYGEWLLDIEYNKIGLPEPDKVIYLSIPAEESLKRVLHRGHPDIHENRDFIIRSDKSGSFYANLYNWDVINCYDRENDLIRSIDEVHSMILERLEGLI